MSATIETIDDARKHLEDVRTAMVTTPDERGTLSSRPVTVQEIDAAGDVWFLVAAESSWALPADGGPVNAALVDEDDCWTSFAGRASIVRDGSRIEELSDPMSEAFFQPDDTVVALRVVTDRIEWWTADGALTTMFEVAKGKVTDEMAQPGESGAIEV